MDFTNLKWKNRGGEFNKQLNGRVGVFFVAMGDRHYAKIIELNCRCWWSIGMMEIIINSYAFY